MTALRLYDISAEYLQALDALSDMDGIDQQTIDDTLSGIEGEFEQKAQAVAAYIRNLEAESIAYQNEIDRLERKAVATEKRVDWLKSYLLRNMQAIGIDNLPVGVLTVRTPWNPWRVTDTDTAKLPDEFERAKFVVEDIDAFSAWVDTAKCIPAGVALKVEPDKKAILAAHRAGREVVGAVVDRERRLEIK